jgi:hypothetical protein
VNWQGLDQWQQWALGIGGSLVAAFLIWLGNRVFRRSPQPRPAADRVIQQNASPVINASPVMTFQPTINIHSPSTAVFPPDPRQVAAPPISYATSHLQTLQAKSEFDTVHELWTRITTLKEAFWSLPKAGGIIGRRPDSRESAAFVRCHDETAKFLDDRRLSIPPEIAAAASDVIKVSFEEAIKAAHHPDPFDGQGPALLGEKGWRDFVDERSANLKIFNTGVEKLQSTMRAFLDGGTGTSAPRGDLKPEPGRAVSEASQDFEACVTPKQDDKGVVTGLVGAIINHRTSNLQEFRLFVNEARSFDRRKSALREPFGLGRARLKVQKTLCAGDKTDAAWLVRICGDHLEVGDTNGQGVLIWPRGDVTDQQIWYLNMSVEGTGLVVPWTFDVRIDWWRQSGHVEGRVVDLSSEQGAGSASV